MTVDRSSSEDSLYLLFEGYRAAGVATNLLLNPVLLIFSYLVARLWIIMKGYDT